MARLLREMEFVALEEGWDYSNLRARAKDSAGTK
jgi:hypothetical protein